MVDIPDFSVSIVSTYSPHARILPPTHHRHVPHPLVLLPASVTAFPLVKSSFFLSMWLTFTCSSGLPLPKIYHLGKSVLIFQFSYLCVSFPSTSLHCVSLTSGGFSLGCMCLERKAVSFFYKPELKHGP